MLVAVWAPRPNKLMSIPVSISLSLSLSLSYLSIFYLHQNIGIILFIADDPDVPLSEAGANQPTCVLPKLLHLLRDCLLSQEWDKALETLTGVAKSPMGSSYPVWKVSRGRRGLGWGWRTVCFHNNVPQHDKTNKMTCTQRTLRSAWTSAQSDQSLCCVRVFACRKLVSLATH